MFLSDIGLALEMLGFVFLLYYKSGAPVRITEGPIEKCFMADSIDKFAKKHPRISRKLLLSAVITIISGLAVQSSYLICEFEINPFDCII